MSGPQPKFLTVAKKLFEARMQLSHAFHGLALCIVYQLGLGLHNFSACASSLLLALLLLLFLLLFVIINYYYYYYYYQNKPARAAFQSPRSKGQLAT